MITDEEKQIQTKNNENKYSNLKKKKMIICSVTCVSYSDNNCIWISLNN